MSIISRLAWTSDLRAAFPDIVAIRKTWCWATQSYEYCRDIGSVSSARLADVATLGGTATFTTAENTTNRGRCVIRREGLRPGQHARMPVLR